MQTEVILKVQIRFFHSSHCAFCPGAKRILQEVVKEGQLDQFVEVEYIKIDEKPEMAFELGIMALPAILVGPGGNEQMFVGLPDREQLKSAITTYLFGGMGAET